MHVFKKNPSGAAFVLRIAKKAAFMTHGLRDSRSLYLGGSCRNGKA